MEQKYKRQYRRLSDETKQKISQTTANRPKSADHSLTDLIQQPQPTCDVTICQGEVCIKNNATTTKTMKRMTIYDKSKETEKASNMRLALDYGLVGEFDNVCRLGMNLNSKQQVRMQDQCVCQGNARKV